MLDKICQLARQAGHSMMNFYNSHESINVTYKSNNTPVTHIDRLINNIIKKGLLLITPDIPIISEEDNYDFKICKHWKNYWLIDPLDGTKEFLKKNGEFTVNISLINNGIPILGVIYVPALDVLYSAYKHHAWKENQLGLKQKIKVIKSNIPLFLTSRSHIDKELSHYLSTIKNYRIKKLGSSLKFCLIAEGKAQIYPRFGNTYIWDTAAGHAILVAAGGKIITLTNQKTLNYSLSDRNSLINPGFFASAL
ncbi:3'(2'),5'-bisphosphate nucleotidase CysQ [Buchnera aphidicola]|uniref:3'(2'),5'-bisphosphate nucleotidase CysQ n=1 Tax=Buchnera aphidicola TaxID=9 RepID=UPI003CE4A677